MNALSFLGTNPLYGVFPSPIAGPFFVFHKVHQLWCWKQHTREVLGSTDSALRYFAGIGTNWAIGDSLVGLPVRAIAHILFISKCLLDTRVQYIKTCKRFETFKEHLRESRTVYVVEKPIVLKKHTFSILDPGTSRWLKLSAKKKIQQIKMIEKDLFLLIANFFELSSFLIRLVEAFSISTEAKREAMNKLFLSGHQVINEFVENQDELMRDLVNNKESINHFLNAIKVPYTADHLFACMQKAIHGSETLLAFDNKVTRTAWGIIKGVLIEVGGLITLTAKNEIPYSLLPPDDHFEPASKVSKKTIPLKPLPIQGSDDVDFLKPGQQVLHAVHTNNSRSNSTHASLKKRVKGSEEKKSILCRSHEKQLLNPVKA